MKPLTRCAVSLHRATVHALCGLALTASAGLAGAHAYQAGALHIDHPWARPTAAGQTTGGGYMKLKNAGAADRLVSASTAVAERVELHEMKMDGDVMRMRQVEGIALPAGQAVELKPGGYHLMFIGLKQPLAEGSKFPMQLKFEKAGEVTVEVKVEKAAKAGAEHKH